jgi:hypothetical protein
LEKLGKLHGYNNDPTLVNAATEAMHFYISSTERYKGMSEFFLKKEKFEKTRKSFESRRASERTQMVIDEYNAAVNDINAASGSYNSANQQLNKERTNMLNNWNKKSAKYMDTHMPVQRKT